MQGSRPPPPPSLPTGVGPVVGTFPGGFVVVVGSAPPLAEALVGLIWNTTQHV